jgi:tripartite ATP-independent transporter DctM subunit
MEWPWILSLMVGLLFIGFASGMPVAFVFMVLSIFGVYVWYGGLEALAILTHSAFGKLTSFVLVPVPLFILMGDVLAYTGIIRLLLDAIDKWIGRIPARLSFIAVAAGTLFGALSGSSLGVTGMMTTVLVPEMKRRNYSTELSLGPVVAGGTLAIVIPPTSIGIVLAAVAKVSIAEFLLSLFIPGVVTAACYAAYVLIRATLQPHLTPSAFQNGEHISHKERLKTLQYILPVGVIIFLVTGVIFLGVATASEAAALGALGSFILAAAYRRLTFEATRKALFGTVRLTSATFIIYIGSAAFSELLAFTGATAGLVNLASKLIEHPIPVLVAMQLIIVILGCLIDEVSIIMISIPIYMPIIGVFGFDPIWFCAVTLVNLSLGLMSPPFGLCLFVMKACLPDVSMREIWTSVIPFCLCNLVSIAILMTFPKISLWLPSLMLAR